MQKRGLLEQQSQAPKRVFSLKLPPLPPPPLQPKGPGQAAPAAKGLGAFPRRGQHHPMEVAASTQTLDFPRKLGEGIGEGAQHSGHYCSPSAPVPSPSPSLSTQLRLDISPQFFSPCPLSPLSQPCFSTSGHVARPWPSFLPSWTSVSCLSFSYFFLGSYFPISSTSLIFISSHCITPTLLIWRGPIPGSLFEE